ncbi:MAG TPA: tRNA (adenosine(37)-N6)-threonylcarbamoyltransferase complex dimerization subunit type 1 TsaB [Pirellulaceae bacterium]|nr:tRNA (adenosine(37)-N6)-threonylcarbamoyltransferase complex dimerization subunit type 1 TsaB [Pirellulaceae bacterium]HMO92408.1 tRNA (adenosine(37)-N6)-threonylcarbamoyltransferase complex dimerization subunit type 1 TsaB [Pirellulaceae bacterium]HMP69527.1 tRNA (adenosine(37)-N6)-threonylcarbamoyltransferase complex dimerization subunit type 1 TsaB [Pirellulaceae bacterium]
MTATLRVLAIDTAWVPGQFAICEFNLPDGLLKLEMDSCSNDASSVAQTNLESGVQGDRAAIDLLCGYSRELSSTQRSTSTLIPEIKTGLSELGWKIDSIGLFVATKGPGSFTGLRIGVTTVKTLAYATDAHVVGVNSLDLLAASYLHENYSESECEKQLLSIMDAQRNELYCSSYRVHVRDNLRETGRRDAGTTEVNRTPRCDDDRCAAIEFPLFLRNRENSWTSPPKSLRRHELPKRPFTLDEVRAMATPENSIICCNERKLFERLANVFTSLYVTKTDPIVLALLGALTKSASDKNFFRLQPEYYRQSAAEEKLAQNSTANPNRC